jgi:hypothetical protein
MTQDQFLATVYEFSAMLINALNTVVQDLGPYAGPALEGISTVLLGSDIVLHYVADGVCEVANDL